MPLSPISPALRRILAAALVPACAALPLSAQTAAPAPTALPAPIPAAAIPPAPVAPTAEPIRASAPVREVTLYPDGATVTRALHLDAAPGVRELIVTDLPPGIDATTLRVAATGATVGSVALQSDRALPGDLAETDAVRAAREEVQRLEAALRDRDAATAAIRARAQAAEDTVAFLRALGQSDNATSGDVNALADTVAARLVAARREMVAAETEAAAAEVGRDEDVKALDRARAALAALETPETPPAALIVQLDLRGPADLTITHQTGAASWSPVYDLRLARTGGTAGTITLDRGLMVSQSTGEDWTGAALTLSTARPAGQVQATPVDPWFPRVEDGAVSAVPMQDAMPSYAPAAPMPEMAVRSLGKGAAVGNAALDRIGATVVYRYPTPVTIRTGADAVRLGMDAQAIPVEVAAEAVPLYDDSAYLRAEGKNPLPELILPGTATLYADGARVGETALPLIAAGDDIRLGFGPIDGLRVERRVPEQSEGTRGLIRSANLREETATLRIENLTGEAWPLRVVDRVPVSTQDDLRVEWQANPAPDETDPEGQRGVLVWHTDVAPHAVREITLTTTMRWPEGQVLVE